MNPKKDEKYTKSIGVPLLLHEHRLENNDN